ncbi:sigma 54 modulation/S30EA ribosomal C-terminal domain-containing protein [Actinoallomurus sp. NPDC050550]|uniref:sigma 54 modulation/S30EA ribosomal C-terminal domain-containing protein n=1 Tax=Actinoallomurus sp. NPDC050550 TaxID=3154937 RepID=UPI00340BAEAB
MNQAIVLMHDRLRVRLEHAARNWEAIRGREPAAVPHEWRHQSPHAHQPPYFPRPPEVRTVIRHKSYALRRQTPQDAVADMELLDYDFHLFTEQETGQDSVVYRSGTGYRLAQIDPKPRRLGPLDASITVSELPAPMLTLNQAAAHLEALSRSFLFFVDEATGRGTLIYHRYDGHYGLITPADA